MQRLALVVALLAPASAIANWFEENVEFHAQATYVWQLQPAFPAAYDGPNSLSSQRQINYSLTGTLFLGARLPDEFEVYVNPEVAKGVAFSDLHGLGGFPNGEIARTSGPTLKAYSARAFMRKTWNLGAASETQSSAPNQIAASYAAERVVFTFGQVSVLDFFGTVDYSVDPRTQFQNWASMTYGAWDFPADARGYTWGAALEYISPAYSLRAGRFLQPKEPNGLKLEPNPFDFYGDVAELEEPFEWRSRPGQLKALVFRNYANMGSYDDALALGRATGTTPDLALVRKKQSKVGFGLSAQQDLSGTLGVFLRTGWNDGKTETYAFTEIDRSVAGGALLKGTAWGREQDNFGAAVYLNYLGDPHRDYLAAGGLGFFLGDGRLNYGSERILEVFYSLGVAKHFSVSVNWQHVDNPGYNRDRGPVDFYGVRLHAEF